jgi:hypothetical protein
MKARRRYERILITGHPTRDQYWQQQLQRWAKALRDTPSQADLINVATMLEHLATPDIIAKVSRFLWPPADPDPNRKPKPSARYRGIAYHVYLLEKLGRPDRKRVAHYWAVELGTVNDAVSDCRGWPERELAHWIQVGKQWGNYDEREVIEGELTTQIPLLRKRSKERKKVRRTAPRNPPKM